jgi:hypothetical protein
MDRLMYVYSGDLIYVQRQGILALRFVRNGRLPSRFLIS